MVRLECPYPGWGAVRDPETDEYVDLDSDVPEDVADRLTERYPVTRADSESSDGADADADELEDDGDQDATAYSDMEYSELREMARDSDLEGIDGRSSRDEIVTALEERDRENDEG